MSGYFVKQILLVALAGALCFGCSSSTDTGTGTGGSGNGTGGGGNGNCTNISGTWSVSGQCGPDTCVITQNGCSTNFVCGGGSHSYTGSVNGNSVSYAGKTATGYNATCSGTVSGGTMSGTCAGSGLSCSFSATKN